MKHIKSIVALMLVVVLLAGCGAGLKAEDLAGKWSYAEQQPQSEAVYLLDLIEMYDAEQALVDPDSLSLVRIATFDTEGNYTFAYDVEATKVCVREFYDGAIHALYEGRATLSSIYGVELDELSWEEFAQFYAELYGSTSYELLLDTFEEYAYDYTVMAEPLETGTFKIVGTTLMCTITGDTEALGLGTELDGDTLKLIFEDAEEVYTRAD